MRNIDDENGGKYRKIQVYISGDMAEPPRSSEVPILMGELFDWHRSNQDNLHPVLLASEFHYRFVKIHPFVDGNGRTARLLANIILMQSGYPMIILPVVRRMDYITSLHSSTGSLDIFENFYADIVHENLKDYIRMIG
jgi:Fic family protein